MIPQIESVQVTSKEVREAYEEATRLFWVQICPMIIIAHCEFLEVYDKWEERGMMKGKYRQWLNLTNNNFDDFFEWLKLGEKKYRSLVDDYCLQVWKLLEKPIFDMRITFKMYFDKKKMTDTDFKSQVELAMTFIHLARDLYDQFFNLFADKHGYDIRKNFLPARMSDADIFFEKFADTILQAGKYKLAPAKDYACKCAFDAFQDKYLAQEVLDEAGYNALKWNHFEEEVAEIDRNRMNTDKLKEKFNVKETLKK